MTNQFMTHCRSCGKLILMTRCEDSGRWIPCDPEVRRFRRAGGPETYVNPDGKLCRGARDRDGEVGYRKHGRECIAWQS